MSTDSETPTVLRIGPPRHGYVYHRLNDDTYLCERRSDWGLEGQRLVLKRARGRWTDYDCWAPPDADELIGSKPPYGMPVFDTEEDASAEGWREWRINYNRSRLAPDWHATRLSFMTTILG